ncbi:MAG: 3-oxoacyl-[acyl-carrier-protein] synthase III C-terminal domain-containing protein [Planctomycetota bacterium]
MTFHPRLLSVATSFPDNLVNAEETLDALKGLFPDEDTEFIASLIQNSGVSQRHTALPPAELLQLKDFSERNLMYAEHAHKHALDASQKALCNAQLKANQVDVIIDVSCTGICIPALDVSLSADLGFRPDVLRLPITESGCAAGSLALGIAMNLARNGQTVLVIAVEMCTLSFIRGDMERSNLIAGVLFGDGAAAAVVSPGVAQAKETQLLASGTYLFPDTKHAMGFDIGTHGLRLVLDRSLPVLLRKHLREVVDQFLERNGSCVEQVGLHLVHTGGRRILDIYEQVMDLEDGALVTSRKALGLRGNISSVSILMVLEQARLDGLQAGKGKHALGVAFGPGLSVEMFLMDQF